MELKRKIVKSKRVNGTVPWGSRSGFVQYRAGSNRTAVDQVPNFRAFGLIIDYFFIKNHQSVNLSCFCLEE
jgi:hypothetical protein